jgi:hypothetical protein
MMVRAAASLGFAAAVMMAGASPLLAQRQTDASVAAIHGWVRAVNEHVPGHPDEPVRTITAMTYGSRRHLNTAYSLFMRILREREVVVTKTELDEQVTSLARAVRLGIGAETFLRRAAVLHADALIFKSRFPAPPDDAPPPVMPRRETSPSGLPTVISPSMIPPLLTNRRVTLTRDGEVVGDLPGDWNLPFARSLLDELRRPPPLGGPDACAEARAAMQRPGVPCVQTRHLVVAPADMAFIARWYHAVAAYLFAAGMNGDSTSHLHEAARVLPGDPHMVFDRASYAEWFGLPIYQAVHDTAAATRSAISGIPREEQTNAEAERLYRRALEIDSTYLEARVRLARLLDHRGQRDEAAAQIARVLEARPAGVVGYYALIIAGRVAAGQGRYDDALRHNGEAAALYPGAQAALLGASHAALMTADVPAALAWVEPLGAEGRDTEADPWLDYQLGAGREVNDLLAALWSAVER